MFLGNHWPVAIATEFNCLAIYVVLVASFLSYFTRLALSATVYL